eukprot:3860680-Pyramimonas_sp.AAC.1
MSSVSLPRKFNEEVEVDLLFYKTHTVLHMVDRCIRRSATKEIADKTMHTVLNAISEAWYYLGAPKVLYSDGEGALANKTATSIVASLGTELRIRARGQHATT